MLNLFAKKKTTNKQTNKKIKKQNKKRKKNVFFSILQACIIPLSSEFLHMNFSDLSVAFSDYFRKRHDLDIHDYPTRQVNDLMLSLNKKSFSDHGIRTSGPHLWNSLPPKLKKLKTVKHY